MVVLNTVSRGDADSEIRSPWFIVSMTMSHSVFYSGVRHKNDAAVVERDTVSRAGVTVWIQPETRKRLKSLLRDPRRLLEAGFPNPQSVDDVINDLIDIAEDEARARKVYEEART